MLLVLFVIFFGGGGGLVRNCSDALLLTRRVLGLKAGVNPVCIALYFYDFMSWMELSIVRMYARIRST